jgi:ferredoxin
MMNQQAWQRANEAPSKARENELTGHIAVRPWAGSEQQPAPAHGHDLSQATVRAAVPLVGRDYAAGTCRLVPTRCPYGGACHACPARVQQKEMINQPGVAYSHVTDVHAVKAPGGPANTFEDCPTDWQTKANNALARGRPWVANVITGLANLPDPVPAPVSALLNRHFHTTERDHIREIMQHFNTIYAAMNESIDFECESDCDDNVAAYVYNVWTDLHLCPIWHSLGPNAQANIIIHELAHDAANRDDEAYIWEPAYNTLSAEDAIDNADSYSNFAEEGFR